MELARMSFDGLKDPQIRASACSIQRPASPD
jgi:hypothetical protein